MQVSKGVSLYNGRCTAPVCVKLLPLIILKFTNQDVGAGSQVCFMKKGWTQPRSPIPGEAHIKPDKLSETFLLGSRTRNLLHFRSSFWCFQSPYLTPGQGLEDTQCSFVAGISMATTIVMHCTYIVYRNRPSSPLEAFLTRYGALSIDWKHCRLRLYYDIYGNRTKYVVPRIQVVSSMIPPCYIINS